DMAFFNGLPKVSIFLSTLVWDEGSQSNRHIELSSIVKFLEKALSIESVYSFSLDEKMKEHIPESLNEIQWENLPGDFSEQYIPCCFRNYQRPLRIISAKSFGIDDRNNHSVFIT